MPEGLPDLSVKYSYIALYILLVTSALFAAFSRWAYDDPFITYRYAENLAGGHGFVYNPGERVLSTTTPLFTLLLAAFKSLGADLPLTANLIGAFSLAAGAVFLYDLGRSWRLPLAGWTALALYPTFPLLISTLGSETPLYLACCLGAFAFYARGKYALAALLTAFAALARPDGLLVAGVLALDFALRVRRPVPWKAAGVFLAPLLAWIGFAWAYFGSPLPVTLAAKQNQGAMGISTRFLPGCLELAPGLFGPAALSGCCGISRGWGRHAALAGAPLDPAVRLDTALLCRLHRAAGERLLLVLCPAGPRLYHPGQFGPGGNFIRFKPAPARPIVGCWVGACNLRRISDP